MTDTRAIDLAWRLDVAAVSDVGRVRRDNQDSGYAGPWLLAVCDGVGGAARGDLASTAALSQLRTLDSRPDVDNDDDLLDLLGDAVLRAQESINALVERDPTVAGTSTTATAALFDGTQLALAHIGDSRAYLLHAGMLTRLSHDHTFVQQLIDEGRITEEQSRTDSRRNLILRAIDGVSGSQPDLFTVPLSVGDRIMLCSDGVCGSLNDDEIAAVLDSGTPREAAKTLVETSLDFGSSDNVTVVIADVTDRSPKRTVEPVLVGAAAERSRRLARGAMPTQRIRSAFSTLAPEPVRPGELLDEQPIAGLDIDELDDIPAGAIANDPADSEEARYALRPRARHIRRRILISLGVLVVLVAAIVGGYKWTQTQWYVGVVSTGSTTGETVGIYRGVQQTILGWHLSHVVESTTLSLDELPDAYAQQVRDGISQDSLAAAEAKVTELRCDVVTTPGFTAVGCE